MSGTITVQNIQGPTSGSDANKVIVPSGHTLDTSAGTLVPSANQVVQHLTSKPTSLTAFSSTSYTDASGFSITITPKYSNSKILIRAFSKTIQNNSGSGNSAHDHRITRNGSQIYYAQWQSYFNQSWATTDFYPPFLLSYIDSPNTTSSTEYKIQGRVYGGGASNRPWTIGDYNGGNYDSVMEVVEIKQ